jgi:hypothetical protein
MKTGKPKLTQRIRCVGGDACYRKKRNWKGSLGAQACHFKSHTQVENLRTKTARGFKEEPKTLQGWTQRRFKGFPKMDPNRI